jgi:hypothetical protein
MLDKDCATEVGNFPICAGGNENMFYLGDPDVHEYFCCKPGQIGTLPITGFTGICRDSDQAPPSSLLATQVSQITQHTRSLHC